MENATSAILRRLIDRCQVENLKSLALQPGVRAVLRLTVYYLDNRARGSVATLIWRRIEPDAHLEIVYDGINSYQPFIHAVPEARVMAISAALSQAHFDQLQDQHEAFQGQRTLWLLERTAGTFRRGIIIAPDAPVLPYSQIVNAVDAYLPEAIRVVAN